MTIISNLDINQVKPPLNSSFGVHYANKEKEAMDLREREQRRYMGMIIEKKEKGGIMQLYYNSKNIMRKRP